MHARMHAALPRAVRQALVAWDHSTPCALPSHAEYVAAGGGAGFRKTYALGGEHAFLADHIVDGRILMPVGLVCVTVCEFADPGHSGPSYCE
jgi:fatty acid synthase